MNHQGKKTKAAAIGLALSAVGAALQGDFATALQLGLNALAAYGIGDKIERLVGSSTPAAE